MLLTRRPSKQLCFFWVLERLKNMRVVSAVDVACGTMNFYPYIRADNYIGVDFDEKRIITGTKKHPKAKGVICSIEKMEDSIRGDLVLCLETIGFNRRFNENNIQECLNKLLLATNKNGVLIFNIGASCSDSINNIIATIKPNFKDVEAKNYGAFSGKWPSILLPFSFVLAAVMKVIPYLRTDKNHSCSLIVASGRL